MAGALTRGRSSKSSVKNSNIAPSYLPRTSSAKPPPCLRDRSLISSLSWFPRLRYTEPGSSAMYANSNAKISHAYAPRSATSPLKRYAFVRDGGPYL